MKACVQFAPMIGAREGELSAPEARALAAHLETCAKCRSLAADAEATEGMVAEVLLARASRRDFAPFVDQVMARIEAPSAWPVRWMAALRRRWKLATAAAGIAIALLAGASAFMYVRHRSAPEPEQIASLEIDSEGGNTVLQTSDGPVVLIEPDDGSGG
ncbi:MAG TPA: zf-HC2 domain-containing protein [Anaeromyxobacter sp.]|nr:zf-HC2 domain-containing protein [Anaeromyxobacter sp.]